MPLVGVGDVVVLISGGKEKARMHVCVCAGDGWFFRIVTRGHWPGSLSLTRRDADFLDHDSFVECGGLLEVDDSEIEEALRRRGVVGRVERAWLRRLLDHVAGVAQLTPTQQAAIRACLAAALGPPPPSAT